jgi:Nuclease-related domain
MSKRPYVSEIIKRLRQWHEIQMVRPVAESPDITGGRDGEFALRQLVGSSFQMNNANVFAGRRIPSKRQGRRREIDLIVCTPDVIHLIEVKNWSGRLDIRNGAWSQTRRSGEVVNHGNLLETNLIKRNAVVEYLADRGIRLDPSVIRDRIIPEIIFMNPRLELDPSVEALPEVFSRREVDRYFERQSNKGRAQGIVSSIIACCIGRQTNPTQGSSSGPATMIPAGKYKEIVACLSETKTWDQLVVHGTQVIAGDVIRLQVGPKTYGKSELATITGGQPIRMHWTRGWFWGLVKVVTGFGALGSIALGNDRTEISPADTVTFHAVGEEEPRSRRLVELDWIILG